MKKKITLQLSDDILERLKGAAGERCVNRAILVEKALDRFLAEPMNVGAPPQDRLAGFEQQLEGIQRDLRALNDTVALHARYHLALTTLVRDGGAPASADRVGEAPHARHAEGEAREHVKVVRSSEQDDEDLPFGAPTRRASHARTAAPVAEVSWGMPAAGEGGEDPFRVAQESMR
ncbi:ribbon-helix-helix domain-containing protein [Bradyrhizobium ontarionense]|uniref:Ribbon-helix-helix domain-containing protein n=1 Tax=Bradyrhizobium ontarionense TaxID=2898149 RepID=A0ABY3RLY4_9BRAD|nr:CopG family transcriptional regulator [Bradyrhizobium sp. A19]UFZ08491.1 ribbon-helix-helix domain-containing protein [Bradyrhizobium sp. A19]